MIASTISSSGTTPRRPEASLGTVPVATDAPRGGACARALGYTPLPRVPAGRATIGSIARAPVVGAMGDGGSRMKRRRWSLATVVLLAAPFGPVGPAEAFNNATGTWDTLGCTNATSGHCGGFAMAALAKVATGAGAKPTAFLVARNDKLIVERYANGATRSSTFGVASMTKGTIGAISTAYGIGNCGLDATPGGTDAGLYLNEYDNSGKRFPSIPLGSLGTHTSCLDDAEECSDQFDNSCVTPHSALPTTSWEYKFWYANGQKDGFHQALGATPLTCQAWDYDAATTTATNGRDASWCTAKARGSCDYYSNPALALMEAAVARACRDKGVTTSDFSAALDGVMAGIGLNHNATHDENSYFYGKQTQTAGGATMTLPNDWGGSSWTGRSAAKLMRHFMRLGYYNGAATAISPAAVQQATRALQYPGRPTTAISLYELTDSLFGHDTPPARSGPDARVAWGAGQNVAMFDPERDLVVVRIGGTGNYDPVGAFGNVYAALDHTPPLCTLASGGGVLTVCAQSSDGSPLGGTATIWREVPNASAPAKVASPAAGGACPIGGGVGTSYAYATSTPPGLYYAECTVDPSGTPVSTYSLPVTN